MKKGAVIAIAVVCGIVAIGAIGSAGSNSNDTTVTKGGAASSSVESSKPAATVSSAESKTDSETKSKTDTKTEPKVESKTESSADTSAGGTVTASVGDVVTTKELSFEINKAFTTKKIEHPSNEFLTDKASDGKVYLILEMTVENISDEKQNINLFYFHTSVDDFTVDQSILLSEPDGLKTLSGTAMPGKKVKGFLAYEVDENWKKCEVAYTELLKDNPTFTIVLDRSTTENR